MADRKQSSEFLGGGHKFNAVGTDTRIGGAADEPVLPVSQTSHWLRIGAVILVVLLLAALLFTLNDQNLGKTTVQPTRGGRAVTPDAPKATTDPNLK